MDGMDLEFEDYEEDLEFEDYEEEYEEEYEEDYEEDYEEEYEEEYEEDYEEEYGEECEDREYSDIEVHGSTSNIHSVNIGCNSDFPNDDIHEDISKSIWTDEIIVDESKFIKDSEVYVNVDKNDKLASGISRLSKVLQCIPQKFLIYVNGEGERVNEEKERV